MNNSQILNAIIDLSNQQLALLLLGFFAWIIGGNMLLSKYRKRLEKNNIEFSYNIRLEHVNRVEWIAFSILLFFSFALLICAVNL